MEGEDRSYRALLRTPTFGRVLVSMQLGRTAQAMLPIALVLLALTSFDSPALGGALTFLSIFPGLLVSPFVGAFIDRVGSLIPIRIDYVVGAVACGAIALIATGGAETVLPLLALTLALGLSQLLSDAGFRHLFPNVVPDHLWERANAIDSSGYQVASVVGPPIAAALFAIAGAPLTFAAVGFAYVASALLTTGVREPHVRPSNPEPLLRTALSGVAYVWRNPTLRGMLGSVPITNIPLGILTILVPVLIVDTLGESVALVGVAFGLAGVVGVVAAIAIGRWDTRERERDLIIGAHFVIAVSAALLLPLTTGWLTYGLAFITASMVVRGAAEAAWDLGIFTLRQRKTDRHMMGRAFAISMATNFSGMPIGAALGGWLVTVDLGLAVMVAVATGLIGTVLAIALIPRSARTADSLTAPAP
jgi:predicted MFS family arabinose efflux permease